MIDSADAWRVAVRTAHFASSIGLFGQFAFSLLLGRGTTAGRGLRTVASAWLVVAIASGALWLLLEAAVMSGLPVGDALDGRLLGVVLTQTLFGQVWSMRLGLAALLAVLLALPGRSDAVRRVSLVLCCGLAAGLLGSLAWAGHANAQTGIDRVVHRTVDVLHLLAAGAWLGALSPFAAALSTAMRDHRDFDFAARVAGRFSALGIGCVLTLAMTGLVNASYTVGSIPALTGTSYGRLLSLKLGLFAGMLGLAAFNRIRLTPAVTERAVGNADRAAALRRLRWNAGIEIATGLAILAVVGLLGITLPAMHG